MAEPTKEDGVDEEVPEFLLAYQLEEALLANQALMEGATHGLLLGGDDLQFIVLSPEGWAGVVEQLQLLQKIGAQLIDLGCAASGIEFKLLEDGPEIFAAEEG